ncbi:MAG TPA: 16S rRNA (adenine(1518)-N(6)/adenine(1519)-N(6))-dimethyltransferase RsmA [Kiritimatiellia bacterium]|nr:16S rRNA (adenine(1518)-N(6)/adenine(1519)-N(6))-dimethyltransferase RsmA [Kiritimatiellia bacterium]HPS08953.1 16S rRNA (adenine(1518)-N(6)/adenine(1519)-N(6))-dimethyltransferase RsmA [Kiritimatiellia bacterium]
MNLTSPSQVKAWCIENDFHPNKTLGQNFLIDRNILEAMVDASGVRPGDHVLEIGPGLGVLTEALLARGVRVTAVEKDSRLAARLASALEAPSGLRVIGADALELDLDTLLAEGFAACVSNLPYSVGTRILLEIALHPRAPRSITVLVQTEVAERFAARCGEDARGQAGVWLQLDYDVRLVREVKASCFWPRPEVGSTIVRLDRHGCDLAPEERRWFFELTRYAFMHRRKQLGASLRKAPVPIGRSEAALAALFDAAEIGPQARAEQVSDGQWQQLARAFAAAGI